MTARHKMPVPISSSKWQARRLRIIASVVLLLGIFGADLVYWLGTRSADSPDLLPVVGEDKAVTRQAETLYGKEPLLLEEWARDLTRPGTQATIIVVTAVLAAGGCLYFAGLLDRADEHADEKEGN